MTQETAVEINDEVLLKAWEGYYLVETVPRGWKSAPREMQQLRQALEAAIPLVVEGFASSLSQPCACISLDASQSELWEDGYRKALEDILAKVKK